VLFPLHRPRMSLFVAVVTAAPVCLALSAPVLADIKINEVESDGAGDFIELVNTGAAPVNVGGYQLKDDGEGNTVTIPDPSVIPPGGVLAFDTPGLGQPDTARVFNGATLIDSFSWIFHATVTTYGRCPDPARPLRTDIIFTTTAVTKGTANSCISPLPAPWSGSASVTTVDAAGSFGTDLSGLEYEGTGSRTPGVLWAVNNAGSRLLRLVWNGSQWVRDTTNGWSAGKTLRFPPPNEAAAPDSEGVTITDAGSAGGVFVSSERNLSDNLTSRISVLRYDVSGASPLTATMEWNLTPDLPVVGANSGAESVEWVPDAHLVSAGLVDQSTAQPYDPADYANHGTGLFFVGIEGNGNVYAYALNQTTGAFNRVATFASGFATFGGLHWEAEEYQLWVACDNNCDGRSRVFAVGPGGSFALVADYARPSGLPNSNNEGFTITPDSECVGGSKPVYWADDGNFESHVLRASTIPCTPLPNDIAVDFGSPGLWQFKNNATWLKIHPTSPAAVATGDIDGNGEDDVAAIYAGAGLWIRYDNGAWIKLHNITPLRFAIGDLDDSGKADIVVDFGAAGQWVRLNNATWVQINATPLQDIAIGKLDANDKDDVVLDFGSAGLWVLFNNATYFKIDTISPFRITTGDLDGNGVDEVIVDRGATGIHARYNNSAPWVKLNVASSQDLATGDLDGNGKKELLVDFGPSGLWARYNNTTWVKRNAASTQNLAAGRFD